MNSALIQVENVTKVFGKKRFLSREQQGVRAVDSVSLDILPGEVVGLVGESACGKSTLGRIFLRLHEPTSGRVLFEGRDITKLSRSKLVPVRKHIQMIFQDPYASLNPRMTVRKTIERVLYLHGMPSDRDSIADVLQRCGLNPKLMERYPHEFSGGQRQRIAIARAIAIKPKFVVCDEPVSALDTSVQAQVINLLKEFHENDGLSYLFISHDLSVVRHISSRIVVMYLGRIVEIQGKKDFFQQPLHPYSEALLSSIPIADPELQRNRKKIKLKGDVQARRDMPGAGCSFFERCPCSMTVCTESRPALKEIAPGSFVACHRAAESVE